MVESSRRKRPTWLFDLDYLTDSMNYQPVTTDNKSNKTSGPNEAKNSAGIQDDIDAGNSNMEAEHVQEYFVLPLWSSYTSTVKSSEANNGDEKLNEDTGSKTNENPVNQEDQAFLEEFERLKTQEKEADDAAETLRKTFAKSTEDLLLQTGAARASSPNYEELLQFRTQQVWILVDLTFRNKVIATKWIYMNKKDERGIIVRNKARIEAIRIFLAFTSYMGFIVYQIDVKSAFLYGKIDEKVAWYATLSTFLVKSGYRRGLIDKTLFIKKDKKDIMPVQVKQKEDGIFIIETKKPFVKVVEAADIDVHLYRSIIGSLIYLTAFRPDIMYAVCACSRFQVTPKTSHLHAVKRIFRRLISWQCKKQTIVATLTTEAEYVAAAKLNTARSKLNTSRSKLSTATQKEVSDAVETLNTALNTAATLAVSTVSIQPVLVLLKLLCSYWV
uniref:Reverse transcriptase Ty1/copia-type domain-containing protein n=1 Tax=Tanacetum cinerariifolium TaxID=118510 RepID=A0A6L2L0G3_TANCI|nr:hypothetical protein [Tanacetum cinerariifolium]